MHCAMCMFQHPTFTLAEAPDPPTYINCLQCDSDTNPACEAGTFQATRCTSQNLKYCVVTSVTTFDSG